MAKSQGLPFFVSVPHSGEQVPDKVVWLKKLSEAHLMRDVDRYVDKLYMPAIDQFDLHNVVTPWHRYVVDLNRLPDEFDAQSVEGASLPAGTHPKGLHWSITTHGETLIPQPMSMELHQELVRDYYEPVHQEITDLRQSIKDSQGEVFHLDLHSMPSVGTDLHPDPGQTRADVVISDQHGRSSKPEFLDIALRAFQAQNFQVAYNWPYIGGGVTKRYGEPDKGFHTIQIELNRNLYMDEATKKPLESEFRETQHRLTNAIENVIHSLKDLIGK